LDRAFFRFRHSFFPALMRLFIFGNRVMDDFDAIDLGLFGVASGKLVYDGLSAGERWMQEETFDGTATLLLDLKAQAAADPLDEMQAMLSEMTKELRERFQRFQSQRRGAEAEADEAVDDGARKIAQADAKAAIEAVSLIVRTLEKIDSLQRTLITERQDAAAQGAGSEDLDELAAEFERLVQERATERAHGLFEEWKRQTGWAGDIGAEACSDTIPADKNGP
jgi:hypothetical protein